MAGLLIFITNFAGIFMLLKCFNLHNLSYFCFFLRVLALNSRIYKREPMPWTRFKPLIPLFIILVLCTCIDPYTPKISGTKSYLVVQGLITDENASYEVKLSRTIQSENSIPETVNDATLFITDEAGNRTSLSNAGSGIYKTDSTIFRGVSGKSYTLHISTGNENEYISAPCLMLPVPDIDSIYYEKDEEITNNQTETQQGIRIFLDSKEGDENNRYFRWEFVETWKFRVPMPRKFNFIDSAHIPTLPVEEVKEYCWKQRKSSEILVKSFSSGQAHIVKKEPIFFIASDKSDRLSLEYSILIKQYSISKKESDFWNNLKQVNEGGGDIFDPQPFPVISNIYNLNNPGDQVLGYFQVSSVKTKRKFIPFSEMVPLNLPFFQPDCKRIEVSPEDYPSPPYGPPMTWDRLYRMFLFLPDRYTFVEPLFYQGTASLKKLVFTSPECSNCEVTGTSKKPDFWIDLN